MSTPRPWFNASLPRSQRVAALLAAMTTDEKVAQLVVNASAIRRLGVPAYEWRNNILHGTVDNGVSTVFPQAIGMAASWDADALRAASRIMSDEQRAKHNLALAASGTQDSPMNYGLDLWGPNINMFLHPLWGRGQETYGEDPILTATLAAAFVKGLQDGPQTSNALGERLYETFATCKHFVAYGVDKMPPRLSLDENISQADLLQYYGPAWESCARQAVSVMCAYNGVNGYPMCDSPLLATELRGRLGFGEGKPEAYVVSDSGALDFSISKFRRYNTTAQAAAAAMLAGVDLNSGHVYGEGLGKAIASGAVPIGAIDAALTRLLHARFALGLFDPAADIAYSSLGAADILSAPHARAARELTQKSLLLLKNEGGLLPLRPDAWARREVGGGRGGAAPAKRLSTKKLAVIGWAANDSYAPLGNYMGCGFSPWSPRLANCSITTPLAGLTEAYKPQGIEVGYARGCEPESNDTSGFAAAAALAAAADAVVFVGGNRNCEGGQGVGGAHCESEGHDRPDMRMPGVQTALLQRLLAVNPRLTLVLVTGSPISATWEAEHVPAILVLWYAGQQGGHALADALSGAVSPAGRSPFSWPAGMSQLPADLLDASPTTPPGRTYRHRTQTPLWSFGYGLSYGSVRYLGATVSPATVAAGSNGSVTACVHVSNAASAASATEEVIQVYATPHADVAAAAAAAPRTWLVGFTRTPPLEPGDAVTACLEVRLSNLRLATRAAAGGGGGGGGGGGASLAVLPGTYTLSLGGAPPGPLGTHAAEGSVAPRSNATLVVA